MNVIVFTAVLHTSSFHFTVISAIPQRFCNVPYMFKNSEWFLFAFDFVLRSEISSAPAHHESQSQPPAYLDYFNYCKYDEFYLKSTESVLA